MKVLEAGSIKKTRSVKSEKQREKNTQLLSECKKKVMEMKEALKTPAKT
jgi:hypothetical protein